MYEAIYYLGLSAHDFTEISAARKHLAPRAEFRFFIGAAELLEQVDYAHAMRMLVFLDKLAVDSGWGLIQRLKAVEGARNLKVVLLLSQADGPDLARARAYGVVTLRSPLQQAALRDLLSTPPHT